MKTPSRSRYIPAGSLGDVLAAIERAAGLTITITEEGISSLPSNGVSGLYTPLQAVIKALEGTNVWARLTAPTGVVARWEPYATQSAGRRARTWLPFAHTGEVYGLTGQTIAGIVTAGGAVLVWTGLALAFRRWLAWRRRGRAPLAKAA